ncbi:hypothetical protein F7731_10630 [Cytobacillus depressus]|uniref:Flagellar protein FliT n=1 Tax=Cytobacillus depressus TaxID=1602942 RepID=A0A6L3V6C3_9BACI|nr:hypothetical protein [Cytobacillus depressus]KAB2336796.1 hypothetical protein F7731_10630 [Cytobacillus depressus]
MDSIDELYAITNQLRSSIIFKKHNDTDKQIEELTLYLDKRGKILDSVNRDLLTSEEKKKLKEIYIISEEITKCMEKIKASIQQNIIQTKKGQTAFKGYNDSYALSADGYYFDKRK